MACIPDPRMASLMVRRTLLVALCLLPAAVHAQEGVPVAHPTTVCEVGAADGTEPETWVFPLNAVILDDGVFVIDTRRPVIRQFGRDGRFVRSVGSSGEGPGEFMVPTQIRSANDTIFVTDPLQQRLVAFDREGAPLRTWQTSFGPGTSIQQWWPMAGEWRVGSTGFQA